VVWGCCNLVPTPSPSGIDRMGNWLWWSKSHLALGLLKDNHHSHWRGGLSNLKGGEILKGGSGSDNVDTCENVLNLVRE
jgi:hypothetical protein